MQYNNLSNQGGRTIAIRVEDTLIESRLSQNKLMQVLHIGGYKLNTRVVTLIERLFYKTSVNVDLVIQKDLLTKNLKDFLKETVPFSNIVTIERPVEVSMKLNSGRFYMYIDEDTTRNTIIGNRGCYSVASLEYYMKGIIHN